MCTCSLYVEWWLLCVSFVCFFNYYIHYKYCKDTRLGLRVTITRGLRTFADDHVSVAARVVLPEVAGSVAVSVARVIAVPVVDGHAVRVPLQALIDAIHLRVGLEPKHGAVVVGTFALVHHAHCRHKPSAASSPTPVTLLTIVALCNRADHYIFIL